MAIGLWHLGEEPVDLDVVGELGLVICGRELLKNPNKRVDLVDDRLILVKLRPIHELLEPSERVARIRFVVGGLDSVPDLLGSLLSVVTLRNFRAGLQHEESDAAVVAVVPFLKRSSVGGGGRGFSTLDDLPGTDRANVPLHLTRPLLVSLLSLKDRDTLLQTVRHDDVEEETVDV